MNALLLVAVLAASPPAKPSATANRFLKARSGNTAIAQIFAPGVAQLSASTSSASRARAARASSISG
jgi:hypothetical protein